MYNGLTITEPDTSKFPPGSFQFLGTDEYIVYVDSPDWDIFGDQSGHKTVAGWVYFDGLGTAEYMCSQYEDGNNRWHINKPATDKLTFVYKTATSVEVNIPAVSSFSIATWHHVAVVFNGLEIGIYLDGEQENYDTAWNADTFLGSLYFGQKGDDTGWFDGRMQDWHISYNNPYNAAPNVAVNDTFTVPAAPAQLVMK